MLPWWCMLEPFARVAVAVLIVWLWEIYDNARR